MKIEEYESLIKTMRKRSSMFFGILKASTSPREAQNHLHNYAAEELRNLFKDEDVKRALEWDVKMKALTTLRAVISIRSEKITGFSIVGLLWNLVQKKYDQIPDEISPGFFEEINRLFMGIAGKSGIYKKEKPPGFQGKTGREAAVIRSAHLDESARRAERFMKRYPDGMKAKVIRLREENRGRILKAFDAAPDEWNDYRWHLRNVIRDSDSLAKIIDLSPEEKKGIDSARRAGIPFGITPYYVSLMDKDSSRKNDHAVRAQVIPPLNYVETMSRHKDDQAYSFDFMLERDTSPADLITRRYPFVAIFKPFNTCSQICVYCQRNWQIKDVLDPKAEASGHRLEKAYSWFRENREVNEVLITGGDPFIMNTSKIREILAVFSSMKHIKRIRIGTRTPVVLPQRVDEELADTVAEFHKPGTREVAIITHYEHVYEITPASMEAVQKFKRRGISVYNQAVFTVENSRRFEMFALRFQLRNIGVDSYYTFNTKGKEETNSYRVPIARLQQEVKEEARLATGLVRTDEAIYNVPGLGKNYIRAEQHHSLLTILPDGRRVYEFHPWEKNLSHAEVYIDTDLSIYEYLKELEKRGENPDDYESIWYYY